MALEWCMESNNTVGFLLPCASFALVGLVHLGPHELDDQPRPERWAAGQQGGRAAGRPGGRAAGRKGSRAAGLCGLLVHCLSHCGLILFFVSSAGVWSHSTRFRWRGFVVDLEKGHRSLVAVCASLSLVLLRYHWRKEKKVGCVSPDIAFVL